MSRETIIEELRRLACVGTTVGGLIGYIKSQHADDLSDRDVMLYFQDAFLLDPSRATAPLASFPECPKGIAAGHATMWTIPEIARTSQQWRALSTQRTEQESDWLSSVEEVSNEDTDPMFWVLKMISKEGWEKLSVEDQESLKCIESTRLHYARDCQIIASLCETLQARLTDYESR